MDGQAAPLPGVGAAGAYVAAEAGFGVGPDHRAVAARAAIRQCLEPAMPLSAGGRFAGSYLAHAVAVWLREQGEPPGLLARLDSQVDVGGRRVRRVRPRPDLAMPLSAGGRFAGSYLAHAVAVWLREQGERPGLLVRLDSQGDLGGRRACRAPRPVARRAASRLTVGCGHVGGLRCS